jgi:DNA end-binding protein Ku
MAPRAVWKGFLKLAAVSCAVKLTGATTESEKVRFRTLNRRTRNPVKMRYVDEISGEEVEREQQVKGYELDKGDFLLFEDEEIKSVKSPAEHTLSIDGFVDRDSVDSIWLEKPYYLYPADKGAAEPFAVIREAMIRKDLVGMADIVLYQKERPVIIEPLGKGLLMTTLRYQNNVVAAKEVFGDMGKVEIDPEMAEIAALIVDKKVGEFEPALFEDTYENALLDLIRAKQAGKALPKKAPAPRENVVNLADILRKSLEKEGGQAPAGKKPSRKAKDQPAAPARKRA